MSYFVGFLFLIMVRNDRRSLRSSIADAFRSRAEPLLSTAGRDLILTLARLLNRYGLCEF